MVPEILFAIGEVPSVPYSSPTTRDVPDAIRALLARCDAFMLARHGSVVLCDTAREGVIMTETIEHTAKITLAARTAGGATPLPDAEIQKLLGLANAARAQRTPQTNTPPTSDAPDAALVESIARAVMAKLAR